MKRNLSIILVFASLTCLLVVNSLGNKARFATNITLKHQSEAQSPRTRPSRKKELISQLAALLEPLGISVNESSLIDLKKIKDIRELTVKWEAYPDVSPEKLLPADTIKDKPVGRTMRVDKSKKKKDTPPELYGLQLTPDQLFIAGINNDLSLKWWTLINDPRIVRGEAWGPNGEMTGETYFRAQPELFIFPPDTEQIKELWILQPKWTGKDFTLELLTKIPF